MSLLSIFKRKNENTDSGDFDQLRADLDAAITAINRIERKQQRWILLFKSKGFEVGDEDGARTDKPSSESTGPVELSAGDTLGGSDWLRGGK